MDLEIPNYTLLQRLGEGTMAVVWLAEHKRNGRKAAMKVLRNGGQLSDEENEKLFLQEGRVLAGFNDRNIVTIYDNDKIGDVAYLAMEYLAGGTLLERMQSSAIAVGEALGLTVQIASALGAMHAKGIVHRDLKPANIMLRDETTPVLTDFGAVRVSGGSTVYGKAGFIIGTREYMSPEQMLGGELDGRTDLYALGVVLHELLTGQRPYRGTPDEIASQHFYAPVPRLPDDLRPLQPALNRLLGKKPADRFDNTQAFIDALRSCVIAEAALRRKIGFSASVAWSSQLRALGFLLDPAQALDVREAEAESAPAAPAARAPASTPIPLEHSERQRAPAHFFAGHAVSTPSAPFRADRFVAADEGVLRDTTTGLLWMQADNGANVDWDGARQYCAERGWDLPSAEELQGLYQDQGRAGGGFNGKVSPLFRLSSFWFWSASSNGDGQAWVVHLGHGHRHSNDTSFSANRRVLGVRRGQASAAELAQPR